MKQLVKEIEEKKKLFSKITARNNVFTSPSVMVKILMTVWWRNVQHAPRQQISISKPEIVHHKCLNLGPLVHLISVSGTLWKNENIAHPCSF